MREALFTAPACEQDATIAGYTLASLGAVLISVLGVTLLLSAQPAFALAMGARGA